jgi:hypothetical protein
MSDFLGFEPKNYTDDELMDRAVEISRRINWAHRMGSQDILSQLQGQKIAIEMEMRERAYRNMIGTRMLNTPSVVVETDPDLAAQHRLDQEIAASKANPAPRSRPKPMAVRKERVRPTNQPTNDE